MLESDMLYCFLFCAVSVCVVVRCVWSALFCVVFVLFDCVLLCGVALCVGEFGCCCVSVRLVSFCYVVMCWCVMVCVYVFVAVLFVCDGVCLVV